MKRALVQELAAKAKAYENPTPLSTLVLEALADNQMQLHAAIRSRLEKHKQFTFEIVKKPNSKRIECHVRTAASEGTPDTDTFVAAGTLMAWANSDSEEYAIEHAMLGAMREGK